MSVTSYSFTFKTLASRLGGERIAALSCSQPALELATCNLELEGSYHNSPCSRYQTAVRRMPSSNVTWGAKPSSVRARVVSNARLLV